MIKKIELWDFECHEYSKLENLDTGLNLIFGESDSGKTSIVRALRLVAYNDFNPACVRTGEKNCQVRVETDKGWVHVKRGSDNIWTTCRAGGDEQVFTKIGKNVLPEAAKILGLHIVELGDMSLPVNIMDQNEGHFMLNELGGNNASGSMRAQIVDEISGLSGIEGLIKEVSLDRHRFGRAVKENEDRANELRGTMHDTAFLENEEKVLKEVSNLVHIKKDKDSKIEAVADLFELHNEAVESLEQVDKQLQGMPNTKIIKAILKKAENFIQKSRSIKSLKREHEKLSDEMSAEKEQLENMPDLNTIQKSISECKIIIAKAQHVNDVASELIDAIDEMEIAEKNFKECKAELIEAMKEKNEALANVDVCPLTGNPVSGECFKKLKFPVMEINE
jgi:exonuclease SbcC